MTELKYILDLCTRYQTEIETNSANYPFGTCYLSAFFFQTYFRDKYNARLIIGSLGLIDKSGKYVVYGNIRPRKYQNVGDYHAWCEINLNDRVYIIDPSIKYNIKFLKDHYRIKISNKVPSVIVTDQKSCYHWIYVENSDLIKFAEPFLNSIPTDFIEYLSQQMKDVTL